MAGFLFVILSFLLQINKTHFFHNPKLSNMATVNVYLNFTDSCEKAFNHYKKVFGGEFSYISRFSEMPSDENTPPLSEADSKKILHVSLPISSETTIMGSDTIGSWGPPLVAGNNFSLYVDVPDKKEADRVFGELAEGGQVTMPMGDTFWGAYFGSLTDMFGINWMIGTELSQG
jgi:PhnB protein